MTKEVYLVFTDECGCYQKNRSDSFVKSHPFYVRSNLIISIDDYLDVEREFKECKEKIGVDKCFEIKWSDYGRLIKGKECRSFVELTRDKLEDFYRDSIHLLSEKASVKLFYTFTCNRLAPHVDEIKMIKMHLQNTFQRVQKDMQEKTATALVIADDMNKQNNSLKKAIYELTQDGDKFTNYDNINKGLFIDYSDQCAGLQLADFCAGVFTANLKYFVSSDEEKRKFLFAHQLFDDYFCSLIRVGEWDRVYGYGIGNVPRNCGEGLAAEISDYVEKNRHDELLRWLQKE